MVGHTSLANAPQKAWISLAVSEAVLPTRWKEQIAGKKSYDDAPWTQTHNIQNKQAKEKKKNPSWLNIEVLERFLTGLAMLVVWNGQSSVTASLTNITLQEEVSFNEARRKVEENARKTTTIIVVIQ